MLSSGSALLIRSRNHHHRCAPILYSIMRPSPRHASSLGRAWPRLFAAILLQPKQIQRAPDDLGLIEALKPAHTSSLTHPSAQGGILGKPG